MQEAFRQRRRLVAAWAALPVLSCLSACSPSADAGQTPSAELVVDSDRLALLSKQRIFFGHQSVGYNVMDGIGDLLKKHPGSGMKVVALKPGEAAPASGAGFFHSANGTNEQPLTKVDGFAKAMVDTMGGSADIAFYKFCYVDFGPETDVPALFERYKRSAQQLAQMYPHTVFVHLTAPLTVVQSGPKATIKKLLGRPDRLAQANERRERFNQLMRAEYSSANLFDLARIETTLEDGRRRTFESDGRAVGALWDEYASDGKHLNVRGRQWVAAHLLDFLGQLPAH